MQARVKKVALPEPKLQPTREYHEEFKIPESWEAQRAAEYGETVTAAQTQMWRGRKAGL